MNDTVLDRPFICTSDDRTFWHPIPYTSGWQLGLLLSPAAVAQPVATDKRGAHIQKQLADANGAVGSTVMDQASLGIADIADTREPLRRGGD